MNPPRLREIQLEETPGLAAARRIDPDQRLPPFLEVSPEARDVGRRLDLFVAGAGSVGRASIDALVRLGPRSLIIIDPGVLKGASLITHVGTSFEDLGRSKAVAAGERAKSASPRTRVLVFDGPFEALPIGVAAHANLWIACTDNIRVELRLSEAALQLGRPLIQGSLWGAGLIVHVRSLAVSEDGSGPSLCCGLSQEEWEQADAGTVFSCTGSPEPTRAWSPSQMPTHSVAPLCATAGSLVALEAMRRLLGISDPGASFEYELRGYPFATTVSPLRRNEKCPLEHQRSQLLPEQSAIGQQTPRELLDRCGYADADPRRVTFAVPGRRFAQLTACRCATHEVLERFVAIDGSVGHCKRCKVERSAHPLHSFDEVPAAALGARLDRSLASLGAPAPTSVRVRGEHGAHLVYRELPAYGIPQELAG